MTTIFETRAAPSAVVPPHDVTSAVKLARLMESMRMRGWRGRPLLAIATDKEGHGLRALTGSHRLAAAIAVGLGEVPLEYVVEDKNGELVHLLQLRGNHKEKIRVLERHSPRAAELMRDELRKGRGS